MLDVWYFLLSNKEVGQTSWLEVWKMKTWMKCIESTYSIMNEIKHYLHQISCLSWYCCSVFIMSSIFCNVFICCSTKTSIPAKNSSDTCTVFIAYCLFVGLASWTGVVPLILLLSAAMVLEALTYSSWVNFAKSTNPFECDTSQTSCTMLLISLCAVLKAFRRSSYTKLATCFAIWCPSQPCSNMFSCLLNENSQRVRCQILHVWAWFCYLLPNLLTVALQSSSQASFLDCHTRTLCGAACPTCCCHQYV